MYYLLKSLLLVNQSQWPLLRARMLILNFGSTEKMVVFITKRPDLFSMSPKVNKWENKSDCSHAKWENIALNLLGSAKVGAEIVQQHDSDSSSCQTFGLSPDGHIYLTKDSGLVLGIKESFFTRRDGQHVHLQKLNKNVKEGKEQRWEFMAATQKRTSILSGSMNSLKRTISGASLGSFSSTSLHHHGKIWLFLRNKSSNL